MLIRLRKRQSLTYFDDNSTNAAIGYGVCQRVTEAEARSQYRLVNPRKIKACNRRGLTLRDREVLPRILIAILVH